MDKPKRLQSAEERTRVADEKKISRDTFNNGAITNRELIKTPTRLGKNEVDQPVWQLKLTLLGLQVSNLLARGTLVESDYIPLN